MTTCKTVTRWCLTAMIAMLAFVPDARADHLIGSAEVQVLGVRLVVQFPDASEPLIRPKNVPFSLDTALLAGDDVDLSNDAGFAGLTVRGELTGRGLIVPVRVDTDPDNHPTVPGKRLTVPAILTGGDYRLENLRLVRVTDPGESGEVEELIIPAVPAVISIQITDQVLVSQVVTRTLTLDEMQSRGIEAEGDVVTIVTQRGGEPQLQQSPRALTGRPHGGGARA